MQPPTVAGKAQHTYYSGRSVSGLAACLSALWGGGLWGPQIGTNAMQINCLSPRAGPGLSHVCDKYASTESYDSPHMLLLLLLLVFSM